MCYFANSHTDQNDNLKFIFKNQIVKDYFRTVPSRPISFPANSQIEIDPQNRSPPLDQTDQQTTLF